MAITIPTTKYDGVKRGFLCNINATKMFVFEYNPPKYDEDKAISYQILDVPGRQYPIIIYSGGKERKISFQLLVTGHRFQEGKTIKSYLDDFYTLMLPTGLYARPSICWFGWGDRVIKCVITSVKVNRELFDEELNTKRLWLDIELLVIDENEEKPTYVTTNKKEK